VLQVDLHDTARQIELKIVDDIGMQHAQVAYDFIANVNGSASTWHEGWIWTNGHDELILHEIQ
jgi:hypothetical protein